MDGITRLESIPLAAGEAVHANTDADIDAIFDRTASLGGQPRTVRELPGGLTNRNFQVTTPAGSYVARIAGTGSGLLAIDRAIEHRNSVTAAAAGAAPPVIEYRPQDSVLIIGYIEGETLTSAGVKTNLSRIAQACRRLHDGARFGNDFDMFVIQRRYRSAAQTHGFRIPAGYDDLLPYVSKVETALAGRGQDGTVPCHNDLLPANFIDDGEKIWLIDYELSGNNDACFELGNIWAEAQMESAALEDLVTAYYGRPRPSKVARARLLGLVGMYGWTLWGAIQQAVSTIDFDFWSWGMERFEGAASGFTSSDFGSLLEEVQGDD
jgi:thiamine kinase-like enzyme